MPATSPTHGGELGKIRQFLLDHERLLIVLVVAVVIWLGYVKVTNIIAEHDAANLKAAEIVAQEQKDANAILAKQNATLAAQAEQNAAQLKALSDRLEAANQQLANANVALATALAKQQKTDATLPPNELAQRWAQITPSMPPGGVTVAPDNTMKVTQAGAVATVQQLEEVPVLKQQLDNVTQQKDNNEKIIVQQTKSITDFGIQVGGLNNEIMGLQKQITANDNVCQEQIKVVKDQARKSKRKWFIIGYVAGFISRQLLLSKGGF